MTEKMLQFVHTGQVMPDKRAPADRAQDFDEIYRAFSTERAEEQASRCSQCGIPFCSIHCPLGNNIPDWLKLTAEGRMRDAYEMSQATNTFPEICGRICPQDRLCEGNCVIERGFQSVTIGAVERHITETAFAEGWVTPRMPLAENGRSIGIVGAGPAGLACAERLRARGYEVVVYDRYDRVGGLLVYGIPGFKLEKHVVARREALLREQGVQFVLNTEIGAADGQISLAELRRRHEAVFVAAGVYHARPNSVPGAGLRGITPALAYLTASNRRSLGDDVPDFEDGPLNAAGKRVVVIGGGDTAMDCVRTAIRQGAEQVTCLYRRDRANMPGSMQEVHNAEDEGVTFRWLGVAEAYLGDDSVNAVRVRQMKLGMPDASGRQTIEPEEGPPDTIEADMVIEALGFEPENLPEGWGQPDLAITRWGTLAVQRGGFMTSLPGVFAGGDVVRGASLVVWAIRDGRDAADAIDTWLAASVATLAAE